MHWLLHILGVDDVSGPYYGWWSGAGSDLGEYAILGGIIAAARKHNCHVHRCWRLGRHAVDGTPFITCRKHHPVIKGQKYTAQAIRFEHRAASHR